MWQGMNYVVWLSEKSDRYGPENWGIRLATWQTTKAVRTIMIAR